MKIIFVALIFTTCSFASFADIKEVLNNNTDEGLRSLSPNGGSWGFFGQSYVSEIESYGCWCYFGSIGKGKSDPIDEIDGICKVLQQGYECATIDNPGCVPYEVAYNRPTLFNIHGSQIPHDEAARNACANLNSDSCAIDACTVEVWFMIQMMKVVIRPNDQFKHSEIGGNFDVASNCPIQASPRGSSEKS